MRVKKEFEADISQVHELVDFVGKHLNDYKIKSKDSVKAALVTEEAVLPADWNTFLNANILVPIKTMYMNALKMVVAPVVFFSIISCISQFSDISALKRMGKKIIVMYLITTVLAVAVGIGVFCLLRPGNSSLAKGLIADASAYTSQNVDVSLKDTIVGIVPADILSPFLELNMLQILFMAILFGIATSLLGKYSSSLAEFFHVFNELFLKVTTMIIRLIPIAVFCSILSMMLTMGANAMLSVLGIFGTILLGLIFMMILYAVLIVVAGRLNPVPFFKRYVPTMLQIFALALAKIYGVEISAIALVSMIISIIVLSMGAPGIPGSGLICLSVVLTQIHVPVEAIGLIMGIDAFCGMFRCMSNCLGDMAVSLIVAKSENELNMDIYRKES